MSNQAVEMPQVIDDLPRIGDTYEQVVQCITAPCPPGTRVVVVETSWGEGSLGGGSVTVRYPGPGSAWIPGGDQTYDFRRFRTNFRRVYDSVPTVPTVPAVPIVPVETVDEVVLRGPDGKPLNRTGKGGGLLMLGAAALILFGLLR